MYLKLAMAIKVIIAIHSVMYLGGERENLLLVPVVFPKGYAIIYFKS